MNIRTKLSLNMLVSLGCIVGVGVFGYLFTNRVVAMSSSLMDTQVVPLLTLHHVEKLSEDIFLQLVLHNGSPDRDAMDGIRQKIDTLDAELLQQLQEYEGMIHGAALEETPSTWVAEFREAWREFHACADEALNLSENFDKELASLRIVGDVRDAFSRAFTRLEQAQESHYQAMTVLQGAELAERRNLLKIISAIILAGGCVGLLSACGTSRSIVRSLQQGMTFAQNLSVGKLLSHPPTIPNDETGQMLATMLQSSDTIHQVLQETEQLTRAVKAGNLTSRGNPEKFQGIWRDVILGMNELIDAFVEPIEMMDGVIEQISQGKIPEQRTESYQGDFADISRNLNSLIETMGLLLHETQGLIQAVRQGELSSRGNAELFVGDWRELVGGINHVVEEFVAPIGTAARALDLLAQGEIPENLQEQYHGDFDEIRQNLNRVIDSTREISRVAGDIARGNLTVEVKERSPQDSLMQALNAMISKMHGMIQQAKVAADSVFQGSRQIDSSLRYLAQGTTEQATSIEEVSSSMEQMATNIRQNAESSLHTERIASQSAEDARQGGDAVHKTMSAMQEIARRIEIIQEIAGQTNILSLNATIEAAKAEDHGKGFAVVASEVRGLAGRSRSSANEIREVVTSCVKLSESAGEALSRLIPNIEKTAMLVQDISVSGSEQNTGAEQINIALQQLDQVIQRNTGLFDQVSRTTGHLAFQAEQLQNAIAFFTVQEEPLKESLPQTIPANGNGNGHGTGNGGRAKSMEHIRTLKGKTLETLDELLSSLQVEDALDSSFECY